MERRSAEAARDGTAREAGEPGRESEAPAREGGAGNAFEDTLARLLRELGLGTYLVGDKLPPERELAAELGVSRATLRTALNELREAGIVRVTRGRYGGTEVLRLPAEHGSSDGPVPQAELEDTLRFRELLETEAARLAARATLSAEDRRGLAELLHACSGAPMDQYRAYDSRLHLAISELAGIPSLTAVLAENRARVNALLDRIPMMSANIEHANEQHALLIDAILRGHADEAAALARAHAHGSATLLRGFLAGSGR
ncbi:GntR family transcriptional regulator [Brevibacterium salitolerans]|uniref:GntR family transcriptional regulator n=1 Tax=Brevibacterium salitolerans TaxID=1403566 RepID=A0ABN2WK99_9MICO